MSEVKDDHFLHQFDRYEEGMPRQVAMAKHMAALLNGGTNRDLENTAYLEKILERLCNGDVPAQIAVDIQNTLHSIYGNLP